MATPTAQRVGLMSQQRFLLDTNIFILLFNQRLAEPIPAGVHLCSVMTELELLSFPSLTQEEEKLIRDRIADMTVCDIDTAVKAETIRIRREKQLKLPDAIIAATAIVHNAILVTNDIDLQKVSGLSCRTMRLQA